MSPQAWQIAPDAHRGWVLGMVLAVALAVRLLVWRAMGGPVIRGDGPAYIEWAQWLAAGDFSGFRDYPLHQLYPLLIAPAYAAHIPVTPYLLVLHMALSLGTVAFMYDATRQFASPRVALTVAATIAIYPALLFWSPYVLSETPFFFFLAVFLASLTRLLVRPDIRRRAGPLALFAAASALLLFTRPVSIALLAVSVAAVAYLRLCDSLGILRARRVAITGILVVMSMTTAFFSFDSSLRAVVLRYPTVAQSLWLSTRYSSSSLSEWLPIAEQNRALSDRFAGDFESLWDYKVRDAIDTIRADPAGYALLAVRRFTSYWLPALFADGWSRSHLLFDMVLAVGLYCGVMASLYRRRDLTRWTLFASALALGILASFSQIDTDGRYRVPAELALLPLAADGYLRLLMAVRARWLGRTHGKLSSNGLA